MNEKRLRKGTKVCSFGDLTTTGVIQYFDKIDNCYVVTIDKTGCVSTWAPNEPVKYK
ncbi:hypothetical protein GCM10027189_23450 [Rufibacter soli]